MDTGAMEVVYKTTGETELKLHLFLPTQPPAQQKRGAIIFFHGGGFVQGHPGQFFHHCQHFADQGLVAASAHYRLLGKGAESVGDCLADAKSAIRWLRSHADELHIDAAKVAAGGGSGGATLAADAALVAGFDAPDDDRTLDATPDALVLYSPAMFEPAFVPGRFDPQFYPINHLRPHLPPMLILHGADDSHFPLAQMEQFRDAVVAAGNRCELRVYPGEHGFANYGRDDNRPYHTALEAVDEFLRSVNILS
jgi:acetyl esterase/lipase